MNDDTSSPIVPSEQEKAYLIAPQAYPRVV